MTPFLIPARAAGGYLPLSASSRRHLFQGLVVASVLHLVAAAVLRGSIDRDDAERPAVIELPSLFLPEQNLVFQPPSGGEPVTPAPAPPPPSHPAVAKPAPSDQGMPVIVEELETAPAIPPASEGEPVMDLPGTALPTTPGRDQPLQAVPV